MRRPTLQGRAPRPLRESLRPLFRADHGARRRAGGAAEPRAAPRLVPVRGAPLPKRRRPSRSARPTSSTPGSVTRCGSSRPAARSRSRVPDLVDDAAYAAECAAVGEVDLAAARARGRRARGARRHAGAAPLAARASTAAPPGGATLAIVPLTQAPTQLVRRTRRRGPRHRTRLDARHRDQAEPALAAPRRPRVLALPRALRDARLARHQGALQADVHRRRLGGRPAGHADGRLLARLREVRAVLVRGPAVPGVRVLGPAAVDVLRRRADARGRQRRLEREPRDEGLLPARLPAVRRLRRAGVDFALAFLVLHRADGLVSTSASRGRSC